MTCVPVVLIPGLACSPRLYAAQLPELWRSGPVTVASHRHGDSIPEIAAQILAAAPPRFALAGLSMGGYLAFEILRQAGHRVERVALLSTSARPDAPEAAGDRLRQVALARDGRLEEVAGLLARRWLRAEVREDPALLAVIAQMAAETGPEAFARQQHAIMTRPDSRPGLAEITCPALVACGEEDEITPPGAAAEIAAGIPGARLVMIPRCGHLSALEQPEAVTRALSDWLSW